LNSKNDSALIAAQQESFLNSAMSDFRNNFAEEWHPYDTPANEELIRTAAKNERCSIHSAFQKHFEAGSFESA
jgi:hypothetical protein